MSKDAIKTKTTDGIKYQKCIKCAKWFEATREHFHWANKKENKLKSICINCRHSKYVDDPSKQHKRGKAHYENNREDYKKRAKTQREIKLHLKYGEIRCALCGKIKIATPNNFSSTNRGSIFLWCNECMKNAGVKVCSKCKKVKPETKNYFRYIKTKNMYKSFCIDCWSIREHGEIVTKFRPNVEYIKCNKCGNKLKWNKNNFKVINRLTKELDTICKKCSNKHQHSIWIKKNKDLVLKSKRRYYKNNKQQITKYQRGAYEKNSVYYIKKNKEWQTKPAKYESFAHKLTIIEDPIEGINGLLLIKCTYCGKYHNPTNSECIIRIGYLNGTRIGGEGRIYCSQGCKDACPIFNQQKWPKGFKKASSREVDPLIRQMCLKRDDYTCQRCGKTIDEAELHSHHIEGATQMPLLANDVENTITLCKKCHKWVHKQSGCTYNDLRCKR